MKLRVAAMVFAGAMLVAGRAGAQDSMAGMAHAEKKSTPSSSLTVTVEGKSTTLSVAELSAMPQTTVTVMNTHTKMQETYAGVRLTEILSKAGADATPHGALLRSYVRAEGTDKYWVLYSEGEVQPEAHTGEVIVALTMGGKPLGEDGQLKLVSSEDKRPARWVRNLTAVKLVTAE
jgi:DMSO/TMAO reductase YedYZ molybdopterin-dependent catalytic subunit